MIQGLVCTQEIAKYNNNILTEFCNFNKPHNWTPTAGGSNASVETYVLTRDVYAGVGVVGINFTGSGEISFNAGSTQMSKAIVETGWHVLSYRLKKSDPPSDITFIVEMWVNGVLQPNNTIAQNLWPPVPIVDGEWNTFFQNVYLENGQVIDFSFKAQSDTTDCYLYLDGMKLELSDRANSEAPTIYTEAPLDVFEASANIDIPSIPSNDFAIVTATLTGATVGDYVKMTFPAELITLGLGVSQPAVTATDTVKFVVHNHSGGAINPTIGVYTFKIDR